jgi:hypothetical protein
MATFGESQIQALINLGYRIAGGILGTTFVLYRPQNTGPVITNNNIVQELSLAFDQDYKFSLRKPQDYNNSRYYALMDLTYVSVGDYLYDWNNTTFFVAWIEPLKPAELILCNRTINLYRPSGSIDNGYGGDTDPIPILIDWPVSLLPGQKGETNEAKTPGSVRAPWGVCYLPLLPDNVTVDEYDLLIDDRGFRFIVSTSSLGKEGFYLTIDTELS